MPSARCAPRACGSSATAAARSSGRRIWRPTGTSAPSAAITSAWTRRAPRSCCSTAIYESFDAEPALLRPARLRRFQALQRAPGRHAAGHLAFRRADSAAGKLAGRPVHICAMEPSFIGGSMGAWWARRSRAPSSAPSRSAMPLIVVSASGGARMQEGAVSLMQMAKISSALMRLDEARLPYISVLTDPTTGGVTASFAMLGDLEHRRAGRADRLRRAARHRADHPPETARRVSAQRISAEARHAGRRGAAPGAEELHRHGAALLRGLVDRRRDR